MVVRQKARLTTRRQRNVDYLGVKGSLRWATPTLDTQVINKVKIAVNGINLRKPLDVNHRRPHGICVMGFENVGMLELTPAEQAGHKVLRYKTVPNIETLQKDLIISSK